MSVFQTSSSTKSLSHPISRRRVSGLALGGAVALASIGVIGVSAQSSTPEASPEASPAASPVADDATSVLPDVDAAAQGLDKFEDTQNDAAAVAKAYGDAFTAADLEGWGWTGSVTRTFSATDPSTLPEDATTSEIVTIDSFGDAEGAASAFTAYADTFTAQDFQMLDDAATYGDQAHLLWKKDGENGSEAALVIQKANAIVVITTTAPNGTPIFDVERTAVAMGLRKS